MKERRGTTYGGQGRMYSSSQLPAQERAGTADAKASARSSRMPLSANNLSAQILESQQKHWALAKLHPLQRQRPAEPRHLRHRVGQQRWVGQKNSARLEARNWARVARKWRLCVSAATHKKVSVVVKLAAEMRPSAQSVIQRACQASS